jgi:GntR family transcriptional regulator
VLNRNSIIPLYFQLTQILRSQIQKGDFKSGQKIPSERDLMSAYHVSRNTVRQAIDILEQEGLLHREHGFGTYVSNLSNNFHYKLDNFIENNHLLERAGYTPSVKTLSTVEIYPEASVRAALALSEEDQVVCFTKTFLGNERPAMYTRDFIPLKSLKNNFDETGGGEAYLSFLEHNTGIRVEYVLVDIVLREVDEEIANHFNCPVGATVMVFEETFLDGTQKIPISFSHNYFNREILAFRLLTSCC